MFNWLQRKTLAPSRLWQIAEQVPGGIFPLPKGAQLRPREEVTLMLPGALTNGHQKINSVLRVDDGAEVTFQKSLDAWHIKLKPGMTISLAKTCEIVIVADDRRPRFFSYMAPPRY